MISKEKLDNQKGKFIFAEHQWRVTYILSFKKLNSMSVLELKGELLDMLSAVNNEQILLRLKQAFRQVTEDELYDYDFALTSEQEKELAEAIEETYLEENLVSHEDALKELSRWLKK
jgi:enolase